MRTVRPARLDPVGRLRLPRRATMARTGLVSVLLLTAAGVLYAGGPAPAGPVPPLPTPTAAATGGPVAGSGDDHATGTARLPIPEGLVGVPVSLGDPSSLALLRAGDRIDLLAVPVTGGEPVAVASGALVLAVDLAGAALMLALTPDQGRDLVSVPAGASGFTVVVHS